MYSFPALTASTISAAGTASPKPGALKSLTLAVNDINAARNELISRGVKASEVFRFAAGPFDDSVNNPRVNGRDPEGRSYFHSRRSKIRMGTAGCSRKSKPDFPAANGNRPKTSQRLRSFFPRPSSIMATSKRLMASTTGGIGTRLISTRAQTVKIARKQQRPLIATWLIDYESIIKEAILSFVRAKR